MRATQPASPTKWVTREKPGVDRVACPWLIRRFVDPAAEILYVPREQVLAVAEREGAIPFDGEGMEFGHHGDESTFDAIIKKYKLEGDVALARMATIVRGADRGNYELAPEAKGLVAICVGLMRSYDDDHAQLAAAMPVFEALYRYCQPKPGQ